jgi:formylglycine-generating enzyme required for sulfatase activity
LILERLPPQRRFRITGPFSLACYVVTRGQFRCFVEDSGYQTEAERDGKGGTVRLEDEWKQSSAAVWNGDLGFQQAEDHPVVQVS